MRKITGRERATQFHWAASRLKVFLAGTRDELMSGSDQEKLDELVVERDRAHGALLDHGAR